MTHWKKATSLRILLSEDDADDGRPLYEAIVHAARDAGLAGANVVRGVAGYGRSRHIHERWRGFSYDLPIVIEFIDSDEKIDAFVPLLQRLQQGALVVRQRVQLLDVEVAGRMPLTDAGDGV